MYLVWRIFIVTRIFLISAVQVIKILSRSFPSLFFARPLISKQTTKQFTKFFSLQILQFEKYENKYTIGFDLNISPWFEMISFNIYQIDT